jgi:hypothetical protein
MQRTVRGVLARFVAPLWPVTLAAAAVGAVIGAVVLAPTSGATATSLIRVDFPIDANQIMTGTQPFPEAQPNYLAGEMVYLRSDGFVNAVAKALDQESLPTVTASLNGESNVVTISATADSGPEAIRTVDAAVSIYIQHVQQETQARYQPPLDAVNATIPRLEDANRLAAELAMVPLEPTDELVALYLQRTSLEVQIQRGPAVGIVEPTGLATSSAAVPTSWLGTVGGALAGALLGLSGALAWRSRSGTLSSPEQLGVGAEAPLRPVIRLTKRGVDAAAARAIYAQLPRSEGGQVVVVGASAGSGSATVARYIAFGVKEHEAVATNAAAPAGPVSESVRPATIVNGGSLDDSPALIDATDHASQIVVVARLNYDVVDEVGAVIKAMVQRDVPVAVVCTRGATVAPLHDA